MFTKKKNTPSNSHRRVYFALTLIFLSYAIIISRLYYIQIIRGQHYRVWAQGLQTYQRQNNQNPERGEIFCWRRTFSN